jgi:hypothetical protein
MAHIIGRGRYAGESYPSSSSGGSNKQGSLGILWDSSQPSDGNRVQTWAEVMDAINSSFTPVQVWSVGVGNTIPAGVWQVKRAMFWANDPTAGYGFESIINFADGAIIVDPGKGGNGLRFSSNSDTSDSLRFTYDSDFAAYDIGDISLFNNGTHAMCVVPDGGSLNIIGSTSTLIKGTSTGHIFKIGVGSSLELGCQALVEFGQIANNYIDPTSDATSQLFISHDGTLRCPYPTNAGFLGTTTIEPIQGQGGSTANRPLPSNIGLVYYDTTISKAVFWDGTQWVDTNGVPS